MRKILSVVVLFIFFYNSQAQILVENSGKVAVGVSYDSSNPLLSKFAINSRGDAQTLATFTSTNLNNGVLITRTGGSPYTSHYALRVENNDVWGLTQNYGIYTNAINSYPISDWSQSFGIYAIAGNCATANYGVCGKLGGTQKGSGVYGTNGDIVELDQGEQYAGYFNGDLKLTGTLFVPQIYWTSDFRLKENIESIDEGCLSNIRRMNVVRYNLKQREVNILDSMESKKGLLYDPKSPLLTKKHYGLIAQELQEIYPDLVTEGKDGYLSINYMEIIPLLIQSIQELETKVEALSYPSESPKQSPLKEDNLSGENVLLQNIPNPFREYTIINCNINNDVNSAVLYIYNMNGLQIDKIVIDQRGSVPVTIRRNNLSAGIYMYSLIVDNVVIDMKRMIIID
jgi:hypothetical protein